MSVLNQMLNDLAARGELAQAKPGQPLPDLPKGVAAGFALPPAQNAESNTKRRVVWTGTLLIVAGTAGALWWQEQQAAESIRVPTARSAPSLVLAAQAAPAQTEAVATNASAATPAATTPAMTSPAPASTQQVAMAAPSAPAAPATPRTAAPASSDPAPTTKTAPVPAPNGAKPAKASDAPRVRREPRVPAAAAAASGAPESTAIARSAASQNDPNADVARAADLIARGRHTDAMALLISVLDRDPHHGNARAALAALQAEAGRRDLAAQTLLAGSALDPLRFAMPAAQLQSELGASDGALATLQRVPAQHRNGAFYALYGGIALRANRAPDAVEAYGLALKQPQANGLWWIGLGLALEATGQPTDAREAYAQLYAAPGLDAEVKDFLTERLAALAATPATQRAANRVPDRPALAASPAR